ncbi:MAG TPA: hypothetical protein ENJ46_02730 [Hellea balneolensis]|uniref:Uncharacterized protein n=1 Tax=Hellea balneolensis TaxID=287478 RepID=A0A7C3GAL5_9PROT|nr:hypothetical protein [Hellea balneolensis]
MSIADDRNIELGVLKDGGVMLVADRPLPDIVKRVEYYREQRLFMLIFRDSQLDDELMHYEIPPDMAHCVEKTPNIIVYYLFANHEPIGYEVPLVQIGNFY